MSRPIRPIYCLIFRDQKLVTIQRNDFEDLTEEEHTELDFNQWCDILNTGPRLKIVSRDRDIYYLIHTEPIPSLAKISRMVWRWYKQSHEALFPNYFLLSEDR